MEEKKDEEKYTENPDVHDIFDDYQPEIQDTEVLSPETSMPPSPKPKNLGEFFSVTRRKITKFVMAMKRDPEQEAEETSPSETFLPDPRTKIKAWAEKLKQVDETDTENSEDFVLFSHRKKDEKEEPHAEEYMEGVSENEEFLKSAHVIYSAPADELKTEKGPDLMQVAVRNTEIKPELLQTPPVQDLTLDEIIANEMRIKTFSAQKAESKKEDMPQSIGAFAYRNSTQGEKVVEKAPPQPIASTPLEEQQRVQDTILKQIEKVTVQPEQTELSDTEIKSEEKQKSPQAVVSENLQTTAQPQVSEPTEEFAFVQDYSKSKVAVKPEEKQESPQAVVSENLQTTAQPQVSESTEEFAFVQDYSKSKAAVKPEEKQKLPQAVVSENLQTTAQPQVNEPTVHTSVTEQTAQKIPQSNDEFMFVQDYTEKFKQAKAARKAAQRAAAVSGNSAPKVEFGIGNGEQYADGMQESVNDNHAERAEPILMYHPEYEYRNFCVMAGKFTKIVRSEYRVCRFLDKAREQAAQTPAPVKAEKTEPKTEEQSQSDIVFATVPPKTEQTAKPKVSPIKPLDLPKVEQPSVIPPKAEKKKASPKTEKKTEKKPSKTEFAAPILMPRDIDEVEEETLKTRIPEKKSKKAGRRHIAKLFSDEESFDESEYDTVEEQKQTIDEYRNRDEEKEIRFQLNENVRVLFWREFFVFLLFIASTVLSLLITFVPNVFSDGTYGWLIAGIINFVLLSVGIVLCRIPIINGLMPLKSFKGNSDTALTVSAFAILIESVAALFYPNVFINGTYTLYTPLLMLALFLNTFGKVMMVTRVRDNFKFLTKPYTKYSGKIFTDIKTADKMAESLPISHPIVAYQKKTKFMSDFLKLSYAPDPSEEYAAKLAPIAAVASIVVGLLYGIIHADVAGAMTSFALTACITTPICSLLAVNIPMSRLCKAAGRKSAMVSNYAAVRQFCDTNAIIVDVNDLYPKGTITLSGMKIFNESKINDALLAGAAVSFAAKGTLTYIFENIIQGRMDILPKVESVLYEDNMGLVGWVEGKRVLIGNRKLMEMHKISIPNVAYETMYKGREIVYLSVGGDLCALLVLSYRADRETAAELQKLQDCGVCLIVRTLDCNITPNHIAEKFRLYPRCITVLPTVLGQVADEAKSGIEKETRAYLATRGRLSSFARAITGCIKIRSSVKLSVIIQAIGIIFGFIVVTAISFISGFDKLGIVQLLVYLSFWVVAALVAPSFLKP